MSTTMPDEQAAEQMAGINGFRKFGQFDTPEKMGEFLHTALYETPRKRTESEEKGQ